MRNGYSEDKIAKGGGEDRPERLFIRALNNVHMPGASRSLIVPSRNATKCGKSMVTLGLFT